MKKKISQMSKKPLDSLKNITPKYAKQSKKNNDTPIGSSQDIIPVKNIKNGIVELYNGSHIAIIEVYPVNYYQKSEIAKKRILNAFGSLYNNGPVKIHIKIMSDIAKPTQLIQNIKKECKNQSDAKIKETLSDYLEHIQKLCSMGAVAKRYFVIIEYEGKSKDKEHIISGMYDQIESTIGTLENAGNYCARPENKTMEVGEIIYKFFNRTTCLTQSFSERCERIKYDFDKYNELSGQNKKFTYADLFGTKGIKFINRNCIYMDGIYYGYIGITGSSIPSDVYGGWINTFDCGAYVDIDIISRKLNRETTNLLLKQYNKSTKQSIYTSGVKGKLERTNKLQIKYRNNMLVSDALSHGDDLYETAVIMTFKAKTSKELGRNIRYISKRLSNRGMHVDDGFLCCEDYFQMTMPFVNITAPFSRIKREILASNMGSIYPFTSYEINSVKGYVLGVNTDNNTLTCPDNFDTSRYKNANMLIFGTSGAGKTFTEQHIAQGMLMSGIRCYFIIPKKGYEYLGGCKNVNGSYVKLIPGSKDCINIMAIRPEGDINNSLLDDNVVLQSGSLLSKKVMSIIVWLQLLMGNDVLTRQENSKINKTLMSLYESFGITNDNLSIYESGTSNLKVMPIISDFYKLCENDPELERIQYVLEPFINGYCTNMNGQTNVDLNNNYIVFDIDEDLIDKTLLPAFLYIAFDHVYSVVKESPEKKDAIFLDEVWKMMATAGCAEQVQNMVKLVRGYGGCTVMATQELGDFLRAQNGFGNSVINNSDITLVLSMKSKDLDLVKDTLKLSEEDYEKILAFKKGYGILISNGDKVCVRMIASAREFEAFNTDVNYRKKK